MSIKDYKPELYNELPLSWEVTACLMVSGPCDENRQPLMHVGHVWDGNGHRSENNGRGASQDAEMARRDSVRWDSHHTWNSESSHFGTKWFGLTD